MSRRFYVNNAPQQTLAAQITNAATTCQVAGSFSGWPTSFPFYATLDIGQLAEEIVLVTAITGTTATITRGQDGSAAVSHAAGATLDFTVVAKDFDEANAHVNATTGVHGVSGSVVGTDDTQTLTNKTLTAPTINNGTQTSPTINTPTITTPTISSGATVSTGDVNVSAGNVTASGTVTGALLSGALEPKSFTNEAAATSAIPSPTNGTVVWLTTPTTQYAAAGLFYWNGTAWTPVEPIDSGWINLTVDTGFNALSGNPPQYRLMGKNVVMRGAIDSTGLTANSSFQIGTLPTGFRPTVAEFFSAGSSSPSTAGECNVSNAGAGVIEVRIPASVGPYYMLSAIKFTID